MLDHSPVYATACAAWGKIHGAYEWPVLLGALPGNSHVRYEGENLSKVLMSIAGLIGTTLPSLGANEGLVNSGLNA